MNFLCSTIVYKYMLHENLPVIFFLFFIVFMEIVGESSRYALQEHLHLITAPLQVLWGKQDQV